MRNVPPDVARLLPHGPAARFVREIVSVDSESIVTRGTVPADGPFVQGGVAPAVVALELAAQSAGMLEALGQEHPPGTPAPVGYIVGLRELKLNCAEIPAGRDMTARVVLEGVARPLTIYDVVVSLEEREILTGKIKIFTAPRPDTSGATPRTAGPASPGPLRTG